MPKEINNKYRTVSKLTYLEHIWTSSPKDCVFSAKFWNCVFAHSLSRIILLNLSAYGYAYIIFVLNRYCS